MKQEQAIQRGFTHFIEVWRDRTDKEGVNEVSKHPIKIFDSVTAGTKRYQNIYTVAIFLIKPKLN